MPSDPLIRNCGSHFRGHTPHWIQIFHGADDKDNPAVAGRLLEVHDDGRILVDVGGQPTWLWNHEPERLRILAARNDDVIDYQARWSLLRTPSPSGRFCFSVTTWDPQPLKDHWRSTLHWVPDGPADAPGFPDDGMVELLQYPHVRCEMDRAVAAKDPEWYARYKHQLDSHWDAAMVVLGIEPPTPARPLVECRLRRARNGQSAEN
jgi:hypothetical protein